MRALHITTLLAVCTAVSTAVAAGAPHVPDAIKAPAGAKLVLKAHATGYQIYTCKVSGDRASQWELKAPEAELHDRKGAIIGHHFAGPTWKHQDGSEVTGKASAHVDSPDANSIPWLLVNATGHTGTGVFANVAVIQRINTQGGKAPAASECVNADQNGTESKVSYSADYYFYAAPK